MSDLPADVNDLVGVLAVEKVLGRDPATVPPKEVAANPHVAKERERLVSRLSNILETKSLSPRDAFAVLRDSELPGWTSPLLAPGAAPGLIATVPFGDRGQVEHFTDRIDWVKPLSKGENRSPVVDGEVRVIERIHVDQEEYFRVVVQGAERLVQAPNLFEHLRRVGMVLDRARGMDALAGILRFETRGRRKEGHAAVGVYAQSDGSLALCLEPVPLSDEQAEVVESSREARDHLVSADDVRAYLDLLSHFEPEEWAPSAGIGVLGCVALLLRESGRMVPHIFNHSTANGVGKSTVTTAFTETLFGRRGVMADAIGSEYRYDLEIDAGLPLAVHEAERLDQSRLGGALKDSAERGLLSKRGTKELGHRNYLSRSTLNLNGNSFPFRARPVRIRFLAPWFDPIRQRDRHRPMAIKELGSVLGRLRPIGFGITKHLIAGFPTRAAFLEKVDQTREELEGSVPGFNWQDPRRCQAWALVRIGIGVWASYAESFGLPWPYPELLEPSAFIAKVVAPVDRSTFESEARPVDRFRNWLDVYRATNVLNTRQAEVSDSAYGERETVRYVSEAKGLGVEFEDAALQVGDRKLPGVWVSSGMLDLFNKQQSAEFQIDGINELARQAADCANIPRTLVLDLEGNARSHVFERGKKRRAAFIPEVLEA